MSSPDMGDNEDNGDNTPEYQRTTNRSNIGFGRSPGRGEIPRLNHYSNAVTKRVHKRRQRDRELGRRLRVNNDSDSSDERSADGGDEKQHGSKSRLASLGDFLALLEAHPHIPSILSWWAQLVVNLSLFSLAVYVVFGFIATIRSEFDHAAEERSDVILAEMATCAKNYVDNKCTGGIRLPALETVCENWERCMNRDPAKVGRAKVSAQTMAEIINNFIDPISWKAIVYALHSLFVYGPNWLIFFFLQLFFLATISTVTAVSNWSFRSFRDRLNHSEYARFAGPGPSDHHHHHPPTGNHHTPFGGTPGFGYSAEQIHRLPSPTRVPRFQEDHEPESPSTLKFVTKRSCDRESRMRTPSPVKREKMMLY